jgi:hypothetical protein
MMRILAAIFCFLIFVFVVVCLVAWFTYRNRRVNLGGK